MMATKSNRPELSNTNAALKSAFYDLHDLVVRTVNISTVIDGLFSRKVLTADDVRKLTYLKAKIQSRRVAVCWSSCETLPFPMSTFICVLSFTTIPPTLGSYRRSMNGADCLTVVTV